MNKNDLRKLVQEMISAGSCCPELKAAGEQWLAAAGSPGEKAAARALLAEIREDISTVDHVIEFFESDLAAKIFGQDKAAAFAAHGRDIRAKGAKWCDCAACTAGLKILAAEAVLLA